MGEWIEPQQKENEEKGKRVKGTSKREQTETCFQYAEREYLRRSQKFIGSLGQKAQKGQKSKVRASESKRQHVSSMPSGSTFGEAKGSSGQSTPKLTNVDSIYIAKHKNGKYYLRVVINNYGRSEIFFLSKEETRAYLLAADAMERERLKQQFAFKYLLHASGGSYDQNREWEVGNGYDDDNGLGLKR